MKLPDIPAIAIGGAGIFCLVQKVNLAAAISGISSSSFIASCLAGIAKYPTVCTILLWVVSVAFLLAGILRIWVETDKARWLWGVGAAALSMLIMAMLNETLFSWAWNCSLYSAGTTQVVLTVFHYCWMFLCPFAAFYGAMATSDLCNFTLPSKICSAAMPFWIIPACALGGFIASLIPFAALLLVLIPLNYVFVYVDAIFIVIAFLFIFLLLKLGVI